jgi:hypothetical protein
MDKSDHFGNTYNPYKDENVKQNKLWKIWFCMLPKDLNANFFVKNHWLW